MSLASSIEPELPFLRRFARALAGSQMKGDARVIGLLEALVEGRISLGTASSPRVALYRAFLESAGTERRREPENEAKRKRALDAAEEHLGRLTPLSRQAFLLMSVEGFSTREAAEILKLPEGDVAAQVSLAGREIAEQVATEILIIEDEPMIAIDLTELVQGLGHSVVGVARTHNEAVEQATKHTPGLVLADIQLADGSSGLSAVNEILNSLQVPVIFITAYPERLLTGSRPEPTFLITKPFDASMVKAMVSQALFFDTRAQPRPIPAAQ